MGEPSADDPSGFAGFVGERRVAVGALADVAATVRDALAESHALANALVFDRRTGEVVDVDLRSEAAPLKRDAVEARRRGRPRLGVVSREVTLLPRHWEWLAAQPGGASVVLRRLVEAARLQGDGGRGRREAAYRFMAVMAGDRVGFEEAARALFAGDHPKLELLARAWPSDIRTELLQLLAGAPPKGASPEPG